MRRPFTRRLAALAMISTSLAFTGGTALVTAHPASAAPPTPITCHAASVSTNDPLGSGPARFTGTVSKCAPLGRGSISLLLFAGADTGGSITWAPGVGVSGLSIDGTVGPGTNCAGPEADLTFTITSG